MNSMRWTILLAAVGLVFLAIPGQAASPEDAIVLESAQAVAEVQTVPEEAAPPPQIVPDEVADQNPPLSQDRSEVPRAEDLLLNKPLTGEPSRFTDSLNPPAEVITQHVDARTGGDDPSHYNVPIVLDPSVQGHIRYFNTTIRSRFEQWLLRLSKYRPVVERIFSEFNLPSDLVYLSLVESGFNPYAYSRARATGPWQFMKGTAKLYGLRVDTYVDERRDPIKSTVAAARYLRDLYDLFGAWPLAMAAYNAGEGKVMRALHKAQAESFSDISKTRLIRRETKEYVPRFMAATIIAKNPDRYGFPQDAVSPHQFEEVIVTRPIHFRAISNATGIAYEELRLLNPELRRDATPPGDPDYRLKVPVGMKAKVEQLMDRLPTWKFPPMPVKSYRTKADASRWYRVRVGDTIEKVAKRFRVSVKTLKVRNNLTSPVIKPGDLLAITR